MAKSIRHDHFARSRRLQNTVGRGTRTRLPISPVPQIMRRPQTSKRRHSMKATKEKTFFTVLYVSFIITTSSALWAQTSPLSAEQRATFHGQMSEAVEPFRIIGNIYYVGARNIASYLVTTPEGHILIDTGTKEMHQVIVANVAKLGL